MCSSAPPASSSWKTWSTSETRRRAFPKRPETAVQIPKHSVPSCSAAEAHYEMRPASVWTASPVPELRYDICETRGASHAFFPSTDVHPAARSSRLVRVSRRPAESRPIMISDIFRCPFCRRRLRRAPSGLPGLILAVFGLRRCYCPHCFSEYWRPGGLLYLLLLPPMYLEIGWERLTAPLRRPIPTASGSTGRHRASSVCSGNTPASPPGDRSSVSGSH